MSHTERAYAGRLARSHPTPSALADMTVNSYQGGGSARDYPDGPAVFKDKQSRTHDWAGSVGPRHEDKATKKKNAKAAINDFDKAYYGIGGGTQKSSASHSSGSGKKTTSQSAVYPGSPSSGHSGGHSSRSSKKSTGYPDDRYYPSQSGRK